MWVGGGGRLGWAGGRGGKLWHSKSGVIVHESGF